MSFLTDIKPVDFGDFNGSFRSLIAHRPVTIRFHALDDFCWVSLVLEGANDDGGDIGVRYYYSADEAHRFASSAGRHGHLIGEVIRVWARALDQECRASRLAGKETPLVTAARKFFYWR